MRKTKSFRSHRHKVPKKVLQVRWLKRLYGLPSEPNVRKISIEKFRAYAE